MFDKSYKTSTQSDVDDIKLNTQSININVRVKVRFSTHQTEELSLMWNVPTCVFLRLFWSLERDSKDEVIYTETQECHHRSRDGDWS